MNPIKLGKKFTNHGCNPCCLPDSKDGSDDVYFPSVHLEFKKNPDLPRAGRITFDYELCDENESFKNGSVRVNMELLRIVDAASTKEGEKKLSAEETLDKLAKKNVEEEKPKSRQEYVEDDEEEGEDE